MQNPKHRKSTLRQRAWLVASAISFAASCATAPTTPFDRGDRCFREVATALSHEDMQGRGIGTDGLANATRYLVDRYGELDLTEIPGDASAPSFLQPFEATVGVRAGEGNALGWSGEGEAEETSALTFREDFMPFGFSSSGDFAGDVVFVGYGIVADGLASPGADSDDDEATFGYDDYAGVDVEGRIALAMRYEPQEDDEASPFDGKRPSRFSDLRYKALKAREAGARALIFFSPPGDGDDRLPRTGSGGAVSEAGIPVLQVSHEVARRWLEAAGEDIEALHAEIDALLEPRSRVLEGIAIRGTTAIDARRVTLENVVGIWPGQGSLAEETVVVGAHFDHLGFGGAASLEPDSTAVHNGADDNASGVAAMLCGVADLRYRFESFDSPRRTLVVASFNGEESGLLGSNHYVRHPPRAIEETVAMVNLDMVGRLREERLHALGTDSSPDWVGLLDRLAAARGFDLVSGGDGYGPSDQMSFYGAGVPVVHFFTGSHGEYHTPADESARLNFEGGARIGDLLADTLAALLYRDARIEYASSGHGTTMAGDSRGFGAYLGTVPDYADMMSREGGVLLASVRPGAPADQAGIRGGDRIIEIDGTRIHNLHDMTFVLRDHRPGEVVEVVVVREGESVTLRATLGRRGKVDAQIGDAGAEGPGGAPHASPHGEVDPHSQD